MSNDLLEAGLETAPPKTAVPIGLERAVAALSMAALCVITFANVVARYLTDVSLAFTEEYSIFLLVVMTLTGSAVAAAADRHIRITFVTDRLSTGGRRAAAIVSAAASVAMFGFLVWYGGRLTYDQWRFEETSPGLGNPQWIYTVWLPLLSAVVALRVVGRTVRSLKEHR
ncbi:TRAP transporter small permease [Azospirillum thermophilum]|uniref:TRAP transporter small permease protein n=1 Tax=Azospirillum thermophilum TaxID=2202148 RepID=A0A2S2CN60_9PROT|nr:TRAP transporter small permease [Azospirillum thermophilum]AWK85906.1 C4-dicarboxylate ABC transporter permease [Azospirillum thermophilum]